MAASSSAHEGDRFIVGLDVGARRWWVASLFLVFVCLAIFATGDEFAWRALSVFGAIMGAWLTFAYFSSPDFRPELAIDSAGLTELRSNALFAWNQIADIRLEHVLADNLGEGPDDGKIQYQLVVSTEPHSLVAERVRGRGASSSRIVDGNLRFRLNYLTPPWPEVVAEIEAKSGREVPVVRASSPSGMARIGGGQLAVVVGVAALVLAVVSFAAGAFPLIGLGLLLLAFYCASAVRSQWRHRRLVERGLDG